MVLRIVCMGDGQSTMKGVKFVDMYRERQGGLLGADEKVGCKC